MTLNHVFRQKEVLSSLFLSDEDRKKCILNFENAISDLKHSSCQVCHRVSLKLKMKGNRSTKCSECANAKRKQQFYLKHNALPIWYKEDKPQYHLPPELADLTLGEKLLISRVSPLIALHHIKDGTFGLQGHCCAFPQDIDGFINTLPRMPNDVSVLHVMRTIQQEIGSDHGQLKTFLIRRKSILNALRFLMDKNSEYIQYCQIDESRLDWLEGECAELPTLDQEVEDFFTSENTTLQDDAGPCIGQSLLPKMNSDNVTAYGIITPDEKMVINKKDDTINKELQSVLKSKEEFSSVLWPKPGIDPINEFKFEGKLFVQAFPWLFPGGCGDVTDWPHQQTSNWGSFLLFYEDGRFAKDDLFCFYAMNYLVRHRNATSGNFFINNFDSAGAVSLDELKDKIKSGDTSFVSRLTYYSHHVKGSTGYWLQKKAELYSWMQYHVEKGHGAPTFFMTLSCAEYFWPDVTHLLKERFKLAGLNPDDVRPGKGGNLIQLCNEYSIVIQDYFQQRVKLWLDLVGKPIYGIQHYWVRYEFAPNRGQIHTHLIAISSDNDVLYDAAHHAYKMDDGEKLRAEILAQWAEGRFGLTATVSDEFDNIDVEEGIHPCTMRFHDVSHTTETTQHDCERLKKAVMMHNCSQFCMRETINTTKRRDCKCRAGQEQSPGKCDTPGFPLSTDPSVKRDQKGSKKLLLSRNHNRLLQVSTAMLQSWRGNCDIQVLIYDSSPKQPNLDEIARVTDYVMSYTSKGNHTFTEEKEQNRLLIQR
jgi:hypothetical protein